jgi:GAF domain-containing protein/HAMP domain-containing protein
MPDERQTVVPASSTSNTDAQQAGTTLLPRRAAAIDWVLQLSLILGVLSLAAYALLLPQIQVWQMWIDVAGIVTAMACALIGRRYLRHGNLETAGYWTLAGIFCAFGIGELGWIDASPLEAFIAPVLIVLAAYLIRPRRWAVWAAAAIGFIAYIAILDRWSPLPRVPIDTIPALTVVFTIPGIVLILGLLMRVSRAFLTGTIRTRMLTSFVAIAVIPVAVVALITNGTTSAELGDEAGQQAHVLATRLGNEIGSSLETQVDLLQTTSLQYQKLLIEANAPYSGSEASILASIGTLDKAWLTASDDDVLIQKVLSNTAADELRRFQKTEPQHVEVFLTDRYGANVAATNRTSDYYQGDEEWWQSAYNHGQGAVFIGQPEEDLSSHTYAVNMAVPVYDNGGQVIGILRSTLDVTSLRDLLKAGEFGQTGHADLRISHNTLLGTETLTTTEIASLDAATGSYGQFNYQGDLRLVSQAPLSVQHSGNATSDALARLGWNVIVYQHLDEALQPAATATRTTIFVAIGAMLASAVLGLFVARLLSSPITRLTEVAERIRAGDFSVRAQIETEDEVGVLAKVFNSMTAQLRNLVESLEVRVDERTQQLRASADVGRAAVSMLNPDELLRTSVNLITDRFGFYYAAIFTLDADGKFAMLREATGEAGHVLKERGHKLEVGGQSMVGYVTAQRKARIALDVGAEAVRFANPLLPETRSEVALPLIVGERVLGALDVQSTQAAAFDDNSTAVLQAMADQVAVALNNATLFAEAQTVARRSRALYDASREVGRLEADPKTTVGAMMHTVADTLGMPMWWVMVFDEQRTALTTLTATAGAQNWPQVVPVAGQLDNPIVRSAVYGETHLLNDPLNDPYVQNAPPDQRFPLKSVSVPIMVRGTSIGVVVFGRPPGAPDFTQDDVDVASSLASLTAIAIENDRLFQQTQRALNELDALNRRLTGEGWSVFTRRRARDGMLWISATERTEHRAWPEVAEALTRGEIAVQPIGRGEQLGVAVPIKLRGVAIGALRLVMPQRAWKADTITTLDSIAGHVAQAAENARLLEETQRKAQHEQQVALAADSIHRAADLEEVLRVTITEVRRITGVSDVGIQLGATASDGNGQVSEVGL